MKSAVPAMTTSRDPFQAVGIGRVRITIHCVDHETHWYQEPDYPVEVAPDGSQGLARPAKVPICHATRDAQ